MNSTKQYKNIRKFLKELVNALGKPGIFKWPSEQENAPFELKSVRLEYLRTRITPEGLLYIQLTLVFYGKAAPVSLAHSKPLYSALKLESLYLGTGTHTFAKGYIEKGASLSVLPANIPKALMAELNSVKRQYLGPRNMEVKVASPRVSLTTRFDGEKQVPYHVGKYLRTLNGHSIWSFWDGTMWCQWDALDGKFYQSPYQDLPWAGYVREYNIPAPEAMDSTATSIFPVQQYVNHLNIFLRDKDNAMRRLVVVSLAIETLIYKMGFRFTCVRASELAEYLAKYPRCKKR